MRVLTSPYIFFFTPHTLPTIICEQTEGGEEQEPQKTTLPEKIGNAVVNKALFPSLLRTSFSLSLANKKIDVRSFVALAIILIVDCGYFSNYLLMCYSACCCCCCGRLRKQILMTH